MKLIVALRYVLSYTTPFGGLVRAIYQIFLSLPLRSCDTSAFGMPFSPFSPRGIEAVSQVEGQAFLNAILRNWVCL